MPNSFFTTRLPGLHIPRALRIIRSCAAAGAVVLTCLASAASAQGVLYDCDVTQKKRDLDWIPDKVAIVVSDTGQVSVSDPIILHFVNRPIPAKVTRNNARKFHIRWTVENVVNSSNQSTPYFDYSAQINKKTLRFSIYASPENYPDRFTGKGSCVVRSGK